MSQKCQRVNDGDADNLRKPILFLIAPIDYAWQRPYHLRVGSSTFIWWTRESRGHMQPSYTVDFGWFVAFPREGPGG